MDDILKELRSLRNDVQKLSERVNLYTRISENDFKNLSNSINDKLDEVKKEIKAKIKKANKVIDEDT